jgi:hypothetical protein
MAGAIFRPSFFFSRHVKFQASLSTPELRAAGNRRA